MDRHYDLTYLNQVFHGNESMVQEIVKLFLSQGPQFGQDMNACVRQSRWSDLHPLAHKLKSSVNMLGMAGLVPLVLDIERISKFEEEPSRLLNWCRRLLPTWRWRASLSQDLSEAMAGRTLPSNGLRRA